MIQAPNVQYPQAQIQQPMQQPVQLPQNPVQQQVPAPQGYYNYPTANYYQYPQAQAYQPAAQPAQANAVNIQIYNPQAYAGGANAQPTAQVPYCPAPVAYPMPPQPAAEQPAQVPVPPAPVINEQPAAEKPAEAQAPQTDVKVEQPQTPQPAVDVPAFNAKLRSQNLEEQAQAIEQIAEMTQADPQSATALLDTQIMEGLLGVIAKDTTGLQGPTPRQLELRQNIIAGKTVTEAEKAEANTITPMEVAERNKQYALYTISFLQELLAGEVEKRNGVKLDIKDLPAIEQVVQTAKSDPNPLLRASALASLSHIAKPEYKPVLAQIFELAKKDENPNVQAAATKAAEQLAALPDAAAAQPAQPTQPAV